MKISKEQIRELTDEGSWERGVDYYKEGNVISLLEDKGTIVAKVSGTRIYNVRLWKEDGQLESFCSCPMGDEGVFCKHCVAVGLTYIGGGMKSADESSRRRRRKKLKPEITPDDVRQYLLQQEANTLVELIMQQFMEDEALQERLMLKAARYGRGGLDKGGFKQAIYKATNTRGFVDYYSAGTFARRIDNTVDSIEELLAEGYGEEVVELAEYALKRVEKALGEMDDSDGNMSIIMERLEEIHHRGCVAAKPAPEVLAKRLFEWELGGGWDTFHGAAETYADVLGQRGLAVYRKLAESEWAKTATLSPGQAEKSYRSDRYQITSIMESLARAAGDIEELVAVKSKDLSIAYRFLEIAQIYKEAGKGDKAIEWAEKGLKAFPEDTDKRLREFLAEEYHRQKRHKEAIELIWANFVEQPCLENYKILKKYSDYRGEWPIRRQRGLEYIRNEIAEAKKPTPRDYSYRSARKDSSLLVEIFIWEKDIEAAWREAQKGGCGDYLWMRLAELREKSHPEDTILIYRKQVDPIVRQTNNGAYREAVGLIKKIRNLMKGMGEDKKFEEYMLSLRTTYKPKRNFISMLSSLGK